MSRMTSDAEPFFPKEYRREFTNPIDKQNLEIPHSIINSIEFIIPEIKSADIYKSINGYRPKKVTFEFKYKYIDARFDINFTNPEMEKMTFDDVIGGMIASYLIEGFFVPFHLNNYDIYLDDYCINKDDRYVSFYDCCTLWIDVKPEIIRK